MLALLATTLSLSPSLPVGMLAAARSPPRGWRRGAGGRAALASCATQIAMTTAGSAGAREHAWRRRSRTTTSSRSRRTTGRTRSRCSRTCRRRPSCARRPQHGGDRSRRATRCEFVAFYRRQRKVAGMPSFSTLYTAINTLSGHYASYGNKYPSRRSGRRGCSSSTRRSSARSRAASSARRRALLRLSSSPRDARGSRAQLRHDVGDRRFVGQLALQRGHRQLLGCGRAAREAAVRKLRR